MFRSQRGMSLAEVLVSLLIVSALIFATLTVTSTAFTSTRNNIDKQFAVQKAMSILEEMKSLVQAGQDTANATVLDVYDDGVINKPLLTIQAGITNPDDPVSGNISMGPGAWLYLRHISVQPLPGLQSVDVRLVRVSIFKNDSAGLRQLAEVAGVIQTRAQTMPPSQVYDVYALAVENVPGWWVYMANIVPFVQGAISDLQSRNPGLVFRTHWIRKMSYGRDREYRPFINDATVSTAPIDWVYWYPGTMPGGSAVGQYYPPRFFSARINVDGTEENGYDAATNPLPYALADQYNHAMRFPDERAYYDARRTAPGNPYPNEEPTWRLLIEDMFMNPANYTNAIFINLHGELFPFPPIRNYSDPAKDPGNTSDNLAGVRVVTHPQRIWYDNTQDVKLRVYSYRTNPVLGGPSENRDWLGNPNHDQDYIAITLKNINWTPPAGAITAIKGGVNLDPADNGASNDCYAALAAGNVPLPTLMYYQATTVGADTVITLHNSPLKSPAVSGGACLGTRGLAASERLYGLEYIPAPLENFAVAGAVTAFTRDLTADLSITKNTARWIITIPAADLPTDSLITIETRIGNDNTTGTMWPVANNPPNLSRTFVWRGTQTWAFGDPAAVPPVNPALPITERFQILGDPRHSPYEDLKRPHVGAGFPANESRFGQGFNRYFDDFDNSAGDAAPSDWPGFSYQAPAGVWYGVKNNTANSQDSDDGWDTRGTKTPANATFPDSGLIEIDIPRTFQILRTMLLRVNSVYTTMTGFSYFYIGIGNEIGYDAANNFPDSIPVSRKPFTGAAGSFFEQSITNAVPGPCGGAPPACPAGIKYIREDSGAPRWWGMTWLGELYPDGVYNGGGGWAAQGNLPTGTGSGTFRRVPRALLGCATLPCAAPTLSPGPATGTTFGTTLTDAVRRTNEEGSTSFFWIGAAASTFHHYYQDATNGTIQAAGTEISVNYNFPAASPIPNSRPFSLTSNQTVYNPDHFLQPIYGGPYTATNQLLFYQHPNAPSPLGSSLISLRENSTNDVSFIVVNGLSPVGLSGTAFIARWSFLSLVQSYLSAGLYTDLSPDPKRIRQLPRVAITNPNLKTELNDPATIDIDWVVSWRRWDDRAYTSAYPAGFTETLPLSYYVMYSPDNGASWKYMQDESVATPGIKPANPALKLTVPAYTWSTPAASFPEGNYIIRVECYRDAFPLHYSFHQFRAFINR